MAVKKYDYDEVISMTQAGGEIDTALTNLQNHIKELQDTCLEMQELFHGKARKDVFMIYYKLFKTIGSKNANSYAGPGLFGDACGMCHQNDLMYSRAKYDKKLDEEWEVTH